MPNWTIEVQCAPMTLEQLQELGDEVAENYPGDPFPTVHAHRLLWLIQMAQQALAASSGTSAAPDAEPPPLHPLQVAQLLSEVRECFGGTDLAFYDALEERIKTLRFQARRATAR